MNKILRRKGLSSARLSSRRQWLNSMAPERCNLIFALLFLNIRYGLSSCELLVKLLSGEWCRQASSHYRSQYCPDLCRHMTSLDQNEFKAFEGEVPCNLMHERVIALKRTPWIRFLTTSILKLSFQVYIQKKNVLCFASSSLTTIN